VKGLLELRGISAGYFGSLGNRGSSGNFGSQKNRSSSGNRSSQGNGIPVLRNIDLSVRAGELAVLAGPNGSGKTTLLKIAGGLLDPLEGKVVINGKEINGLRPRERAEFTALLFQGRESPWSFTVRETIAQGRFSRRGWLGAETKTDREAVNAAVEKAGLAALADRPITELSGGELQRVYIARCIAQGAAFLLLDEPENNLDPRYAHKVLTLLSDLVGEGRGAIVSLHDLRLASHFAHRIILLSQGGTISALGSPEEVLTEEILSAVYDMPPELVRDLIL
jgi:iron complex transport system ATP-binding protein